MPAKRLKRFVLLLLAPLLLAPVSGCGSSSGDSPSPSPSSLTISRADLGDQWPLTINPITLHCEASGPYQYVTFDYNGTTFALNGTARGVASERGWTDWQPDLWADDPRLEGAKVIPNELVSRGLALCPAS